MGSKINRFAKRASILLLLSFVWIAFPTAISYAQGKKLDKNEIVLRIKPIYDKLYANTEELKNLNADLKEMLNVGKTECERLLKIASISETMAKCITIYSYAGHNIFRWGLISERGNVELNCFFESEDTDRTISNLEHILKDAQRLSAIINIVPMLHLLDKLKGNIRSSIEVLKEYKNILIIVFYCRR